MNPSEDNRFEAFFADDDYLLLKNHLYNYLLRRRAVRRCQRKRVQGPILEVGSGMSPMTEASGRVVYSELSFAAIMALKRRQPEGSYVVADAASLPFKAGTFQEIICSEVLEHLPDDRSALREMACVLKAGGALILTFPHRRCYFACDDRFVNHFRRYELDEMVAHLIQSGLHPAEVRKVLGPLEKATMWLTISAMPLLDPLRRTVRSEEKGKQRSRILVPLFRWINLLYCLPVWLDACLAPRKLSSVLLVRATRNL